MSIDFSIKSPTRWCIVMWYLEGCIEAFLAHLIQGTMSSIRSQHSEGLAARMSNC